MGVHLILREGEVKVWYSAQSGGDTIRGTYRK